MQPGVGRQQYPGHYGRAVRFRHQAIKLGLEEAGMHECSQGQMYNYQGTVGEKPGSGSMPKTGAGGEGILHIHRSTLCKQPDRTLRGFATSTLVKIKRKCGKTNHESRVREARHLV